MIEGMSARASWPVVLLFVVSAPFAAAQRLYSYVDENGVRNFTNVPPRGNVHDLKVVGPHIVTDPTPYYPEASSGPTKYDPIIDRYANQYEVDPSLIRSMIAAESNFKPFAVSSKGAKGLMQLMPGTAASLGVRNVFDPDENIRGGTQHMKKLLDLFDNDLKLSLAAYNAGENLVQKVKRIPNIKETQNYVRSVTKRYGKSQLEIAQEVPNPIRPVYRYFDQNGVLHLTNFPRFPNVENNQIRAIAGGVESTALQVP